MSLLVGNPNGALPITAVDIRILGQQWRQDVEIVDFGCGAALGEYNSPWWPASGLIGDPHSQGLTAFETMRPDTWGEYDVTAGTSGRFGFSGITRDAYGSPLGGMTVKLYRTSTDEMVSSVVSDVNGNFTVLTPYYPDAHFINIYKTGSPDVFGTTANTLVGA